MQSHIFLQSPISPTCEKLCDIEPTSDNSFIFQLEGDLVAQTTGGEARSVETIADNKRLYPGSTGSSIFKQDSASSQIMVTASPQMCLVQI